MVADDLLKDLNPQQQQVAKYTDGPLLVLAGAGTGKTRCIIYRAAYLIASAKVNLPNLLIVTFTNKAARELRQRLKDIFNLDTHNLWVGTFHALFCRILRFEAQHLPVKSSFLIYDDNDRKTLFRQIYKKMNIDTKNFVPRAVRSVISRQKNSLITPQYFWQFNDENIFTETVYKIYQQYQKELLQRNALDFDDILLYTAFLFNDHKEVRQKWQNRFKYIMIDEYQDTNFAQFKIIKLLAQKHQNICVVGDDDQAIYTWRGANIANILNFHKDYKDVKIVKLEQNYRSHKNILSLANSLIKNNSDRHSKELYTDIENPHLPLLLTLNDEKEEAQFVAKELKRLHESGNWHESAVLYRTNAQSRIMESVLVQQKIPYQIYGGVNFFQRKEIKDTLAYLRLLLNPADSESLLRCLDLQKGIGKTTVSRLLAAAQEKNTLPFLLITNDDLDFLKSRARKNLAVFRSLMQNISDSTEKLPLPELIAEVIAASGLGDTYAVKNGKKNRSVKLLDPTLISKQENLLELISSARSFADEYYELNQNNPDLLEYINSATLQTDLDTADETEDHVSLMTMHNAKGLEFKNVFIIGLEEGLLPHSRSLEEDAAAGKKSKLEEERRLLYVGITRSENFLALTFTRYRRFAAGVQKSQPSRFIKELDHTFLDSRLYDPFAGFSFNIPQPVHKLPRKVTLESQKHYSIGQIVTHSRFGSGIILNVSGAGTDALLTIKFDKGIIKKIVGSYVELK